MSRDRGETGVTADDLAIFRFAVDAGLVKPSPIGVVTLAMARLARHRVQMAHVRLRPQELEACDPGQAGRDARAFHAAIVEISIKTSLYRFSTSLHRCPAPVPLRRSDGPAWRWCDAPVTGPHRLCETHRRPQPGGLALAQILGRGAIAAPRLGIWPAE